MKLSYDILENHFLFRDFGYIYIKVLLAITIRQIILPSTGVGMHGVDAISCTFHFGIIIESQPISCSFSSAMYEIAKVIGIIRIHGTALAVGFSLTVCISVIIVLIGTLQTV